MDLKPYNSNDCQTGFDNFDYKDIEYQATEDNVIAHEQAHMSAGGSLCSGVSYFYELKDNGKAYIVAGEVPISMSEDPDPKVTMMNMEIVIRSALAPADPSAQDLAVAGEASGRLANARTKVQEQDLKLNSVFDD